MYKPPQKKNSPWTPTTIQKKGKSQSKLGHFSIQPKSNPSSASSQEIGEYSRDSADRLTANVMRSLQTREQELAEESTLQPKFESPWAPTFEPPPPLPQSPASQLKGAFAPVSENPIQRQCAECAKEEEEQKGEERKDLEETGIQTKLTVGAPGDTYEQEADQVETRHGASLQVMSTSAPPDSSASVQRQLDTNHPHHPHQIWQRAQSIKPVMQRRIDPRLQMRQMIQRAAQIDGNQASGDLESRLNASKGGGSPLSEDVRGFMEPRFGADFSGVRVHTGGEAVQMNQELGAQAFTHGSDVYFGQGKEPGNNELTAHELTHVVQQGGGVKAKPSINQSDLSNQSHQKTFPENRGNTCIQRQDTTGGTDQEKDARRRAAIFKTIDPLIEELKKNGTLNKEQYKTLAHYMNGLSNADIRKVMNRIYDGVKINGKPISREETVEEKTKEMEIAEAIKQGAKDDDAVGEKSNIAQTVTLYTGISQSGESEHEKVKKQLEKSNIELPDHVKKAFNELGIKEREDKGTERIEKEYWKNTNNKESTPWCGAFAEFIFNTGESGYPGARNWATIGKNKFDTSDKKGNTKDPIELKNIIFGSIVVFGYPRGKGHVGIAIGKTDDGGIILVGGNQNDMVQFKVYYNLEEVISIRHPKGLADTKLPLISDVSNIPINRGHDR